MAGIKQDGGTVDNTETVTGLTYGIEIFGGIGQVDNSGAVNATAASGAGVVLLKGGSVDNESGGVIKGGKYGVYVAGGGATITNDGTIEGGTVAVEFAGSGANTLNLQTDSVLRGSVVGSTAKGATNALVLEGNGTADNAFLNFDTLSVQASSGTWTLGGVSEIAATTVSIGTLAITGALETAIDESAGTTVTIGSKGALTLKGASTLNATMEGQGTLALRAGDTTIASGAVIAVSHWSILGATASVTIDEQLEFEGDFTAGSGAVIDLSATGDYFGLGGSAGFSGATLTSTVKETLFDGATTKVSGLTVDGDAGFSNDFSLKQTGLVTLGGSAGLDNLSGTWDISDNAGIALSGKNALTFSNDGGLFEKTGGSGVSAIAPAFYNAGEVLVSIGALDLERAVNGTGSDEISGAATLEFGASVANTQTIDFTGADGRLDLGSPTGFAGSLSGFDKVGSNDAVELLGAWSISGYTQNSASEGTLTLKDGKESASLVFDATYSKTLFDAKVSSGITTITYG